MEIIPAILPKDYREIEEKTELVQGLAHFIQIDICDGKFVPSVTWPYKKRDENFEALQREEIGLPFWEDVEYEFDLMIANPLEEVQKWIIAGGSRIVLHAESTPDLMPTIMSMENLVDIGIAINISTPLEILDNYIEKISYIQLMGIEKIGFQSQPFDTKVLEKIKEVKKKYPHLKVQIDGGVNLETASALKEAGADRLIVGSGLFGHDGDVERVVDTFRKLERI